MKDPTRIPRVLDELRATWEGQPNLSLPTLFGILANRGVAWGTTDEELISALRAEAQLHPADLPRDTAGRVSGNYLITTTEPQLRVTCTPQEVVLRIAGQLDRQPGVWMYSAIRPTGPGRLLVLSDEEGFEHKLGMVTLITALDDDSPLLHGLHRAERGNCVWLVTTTDGARHVVGHSVSTWNPQQRHVDNHTQSWETMVNCQVGQEWVFRNKQAEEITQGVVDTIILLET